MAAIVVVGGGLAGLTCAWRLRRAGHDVEVLERGARPGGRMRSERRGDFVLERAVRFVSSRDRNLARVASALGLDAVLHPIGRGGIAVLRSWELHPLDLSHPGRVLRSPLLSPPARLRVAALALERLRRGARGSGHGEVAQDCGADAAAFALEAFGREGLDYALGPVLASALGCEPEELAWSVAREALLRLGSPARLQSFVGGSGVLTRSLAAELPVRTDCEALAVETETGGARIRYRVRGRERSVFADAAVMAVPGCEVARVCPKLTPDERGFFEQVRYSRGITVDLLFDAPPAVPPHYCAGLPRAEGFDLAGVTVEHHKPGMAPPGAGLLSARLAPAAAARLWGAPDEAVARPALDALAATPFGRLHPFEFAVHRWPTLLPCFEAGSPARLARFRHRIDRSPRLAFAGDYLLGPSADAALTSGMRAATEVLRGL